MINRTDLDRLFGADVYGSDGSKIGSVGQIYLDDQTGEPSFVAANTGLLGMSQSLIPLRDATIGGHPDHPDDAPATTGR
jgi:sporulation protein YlmC with PRC-barrel domain